MFYELGDFCLLKEIDQRIYIKFCVKNGIKCNKECEMLTKAYGESAMNKARVYELYKRFQKGCEDVENDGTPWTPQHINNR